MYSSSCWNGITSCASFRPKASQLLLSKSIQPHFSFICVPMSNYSDPYVHLVMFYSLHPSVMEVWHYRFGLLLFTIVWIYGWLACRVRFSSRLSDPIHVSMTERGVQRDPTSAQWEILTVACQIINHSDPKEFYTPDFRATAVHSNANLHDFTVIKIELGFLAPLIEWQQISCSLQGQSLSFWPRDLR